MSIVYKYELEINDHVLIEMPRLSEIRKVAYQAGHLYVWAEVNPNAQMCLRHFRIIGTGHHFDCSKLSFIDTVFDPIRPLVWHIYDAGEDR